MAEPRAGDGSGADPERVGALDFESAMQRLERLVEEMESGELSLEESLRRYEQGIALSRRCKEVLDTAELRLRELDRAIAADEDRRGAGADAPPNAEGGDGESAPF